MVKMPFNKNSSEDNTKVPDSACDKKKNKKHVKDKEKELISDSEQSPKPKKAKKDKVKEVILDSEQPPKPKKGKKDKEKELVSETEGMPKPKKGKKDKENEKEVILDSEQPPKPKKVEKKVKEQNDSNKNARAEAKEQAAGWEGFVKTLSKMQASQLSKLLKNKGKI